MFLERKTPHHLPLTTRSKRLKTLATVTLALILAKLHAQEPSLLNFGNITDQNGLPRLSVRAIAQSPEGIMWFGLEGNGLCRYDGHEFEVFNESSPLGSRLSDDQVEAIQADSNRNIWIGTANGLNRLARDTGQINWYQHDSSNPASLPNDRISALEHDEDGRIWIGTDDGLCYLDPEKPGFISVPPPAGRAKTRIRDLLLDEQGRLWVMTTKETYQVDRRTLAATLLPYQANDIPPRETYCGTFDKKGRIWLSTDAGHIIFDPAANTITPFPIYDDSGSIRPGGGAVAETDSQGRIWFGTFAEGFIIIEPETGQVWIRDQLAALKGEPRPLASRAITRDKDGRIWVGTKFHGLVFYQPDRETFTHWPAHLFAPQDGTIAAPLCVAIAADGIVWVGSHQSEGLTRLDPTTGNTQQFPTNARDDRIQSIKVTPDGTVLAGGINGISVLDPSTGEQTYTLTGSVTDILMRDDGTTWLATNQGLKTFDPKTFEAKPIANWPPATNDFLAKLDCRTLHLDADNKLWISTRLESIYRLDTLSGAIAKLEDLATNHPPTIKAGRAFLSGSHDILWIATKASGLVRFDKKSATIKTYATEAGFASKTAFGILQDSQDHLWISSDQGICRFDPATEDVACFGTQHGLQAAVFEPNAQATAPDGTFYFAGHNGLNAFRPETVSTSSNGGELIFTELRIGNQTRLRDLAQPPPLQLAYDENQIMINFSLLDYGSHGRTQYAYRMSGITDEWIDIGTRHTVSFNYLPHGKYTFELRARTQGASWATSSQNATLSLEIAAPYWATLTFRAAIASLVILLLLAIYLSLYIRGKIMRRRLQNLVEERTHELQEANTQLTTQKAEIEQSRQIIARSRDELEEIVVERTRELEAAKNQAEESDRLKSAFLSNMSHEIRTPMNAIVGFSSMISLADISQKDREDYTKIINHNCSSLLMLIDDILDLSAIEAGRLHIDPQAFNLDELMASLAISFSALVSTKDPEQFQFHVAPQADTRPIRIVTDCERLRQILTNLITNAIKFTAQGHVHVSYEVDRFEKTLRFKVEDTGIGMKTEHLEVIWDRFRKIEDDTSKLFRGTGLGLAITKNLVELLGGEIHAQSILGQGACFTFTIPLVQPSETQIPQAKQATQTSQTAPAEPAPSETLPTVLIAEDEDYNFKYLSLQIPPHRARVIRAYNGQEAVEICHRESNLIELIFMDIKMPILDGKEAASQIKRFAPHIPIIASTAYASKGDKEALLLSRNFDAYLSKPTSIDEIDRVLEQYLDLHA